MKNVEFSYSISPKKNILKIVHWHVKQGEQLFIHGPSGSGKSTLLNLICGLQTANLGNIRVLGKSFDMMSTRQKDKYRAEHIGYIFQQFNLIPYLNLIENITLPCKFSQIRKEKALKTSKSLEKEAIRLLDNLGINSSAILKRSVSELSIGQQQRVAIARALIGSPDIIIADEPTSALDSEHKTAFVKMLFDECEKENITLVFVSHDESLKNHFQRCIKLSSINSIKAEEME